MKTSTQPVETRASRLSDFRAQRPMLSIPEAGRLGWGLSRPTAYALASRGEFPCDVLRIGQRYFVRLADVARAVGIDPADLLTEAE